LSNDNRKSTVVVDTHLHLSVWPSRISVQVPVTLSHYDYITLFSAY